MTLEKNGKVAPPSAVVPREWHALKAEEVLHHLEGQGKGGRTVGAGVVAKIIE